MLTVRRARTDEDFEKAYDIRWRGYRKYFASRAACTDELDRAPNCLLLLAEASCCGQAVGTLRILNRRSGRIELDRFIDVADALDATELPCAEATRFSVPPNPLSPQIKQFLWKAFFLFCQREAIPTMLISVRPPAARDYRFLMFEDVGTRGEYAHPDLGGRVHRTYKIRVPHVYGMFERNHHPLFAFMFGQQHHNITLD